MRSLIGRTAPVTVGIADRHPLFARALTDLLSQHRQQLDAA